MIHLCLLAAGNGKRFGENKLLALLNGRAVWTYGYSTLREISVQTGAQLHVVSRYREILDTVGAEGVDCPESVNGISYSIRAACASCGKTDNRDKLLFLAADQPFIKAETIRKLVEIPLSARTDARGFLAACTWDGRESGNPVVFSGVLVPELMKLNGDKGGKSVLRSCPDRVAKVLCSSAELADIDTQEDLISLQIALNQS